MSHYTLTLPQDTELAARLSLAAFPRSAAYNPRWVLENLMGPNVLWLAEARKRCHIIIYSILVKRTDD
jgi:hypothetical protein